jgi:N-acetyl-anhydromuramyl-L-alanine amidase AmpD
LSGLLVAFVVAGCATPRPGAFAPRAGDEIIVAGRFVHTGTRVVTWLDPGGYDAYRVERRFAPFDQSSWETSRVAVAALRTPNRYGLRRDRRLTAGQIEQVRGGGWDLPLLRQVVDQFVIHFDACGTSRQCFKVLHDVRCLSVHFLLDLDGTIYQTLDLKERAWHATTANTRSVGIEIANIGAFPPRNARPLDEWYEREPDGRTRLTIPPRFGDGGQRTPGFAGRPARPEPVTGTVQGQELVQYDLTPEQYAALIKLTAALCRVFPNLKCDYPRDADNRLIPHKLSDEVLDRYQGLLGHWHVQTNKVDPGPAFQWDHVVSGARRLLWSGTGLGPAVGTKGSVLLLAPRPR